MIMHDHTGQHLNKFLIMHVCEIHVIHWNTGLHSCYLLINVLVFHPDDRKTDQKQFMKLSVKFQINVLPFHRR
jgi:hypothetical protein